MSPGRKGPIATWRPIRSKAWFIAELTVTDELVTEWNAKVDHDDVAWLIGETSGPVGRLNGRKYFVSGARSTRVPLLGGPVFGRPVVIVTERPERPAGRYKGREDWLVHGGPDGDDTVLVDPEAKRINVTAQAWGGLPVGADEIAALVTGVDCDAVPDISQWKTIHS